MRSVQRSRTTIVLLCACLVVITACGGAAPESQRSAGEPASAAPRVAEGKVNADAHLDAQSGPAAQGAPAPDVPAAPSSLMPQTAAVVAPAPTFREVVVPAGTTLRLRLRTVLASDANAVEDPVRATIELPVKIDGATVIPSEADVTGAVTAVQRSGKVNGRASLAFRFDRLSAWDEAYDVHTEAVSRQARATKRKDATKIGIGAGAGALVGAIAGGGKGAAIGTAVGGGAGTGVVLATRGEEVRLPVGTVVMTKLAAPLTVRVPND